MHFLMTFLCLLKKLHTTDELQISDLIWALWDKDFGEGIPNDIWFKLE